MTLVIDPEFKSLIPPLAPDELAQLEASLLSEGCRDALVVWAGQNVLVDGHNRYALCQKHNLPYQTVERQFESRADVVIWMVQNQFARRNLQAFVRGELALRMKEAIAEKAKAQQGKRTDILQNFAEGFEPINTRQEIAHAAEVSQETIRKVEHVAKSAPETVKQAARAGDISTHRAFQITQQLDKLPAADHDRAASLSGDELEKYAILARLFKSMGSPETNGTYEEIIRTGGFHYGKDMQEWLDYAKASIQDITRALQSVADHHKIIHLEERRKKRVAEVNAALEETGAVDTIPARFAILYADPPWQYTPYVQNRRIENHYPTMTIEEICALPVEQIAHDDAMLFLWCPSSQLEYGMQVIPAWGFKYVTSMVWIKDGTGLGYYTRQNHELLLIGKRGALPTPEPAHRPSSVIEAPKNAHSEKPAVVYDLIERMYPEYGKVELFARTKRENWYGWGGDYAKAV